MLWGRSLYQTSLVVFMAIFAGLVAVIFIDIIPQSFRTGQFWNAIIVISSLFIWIVTFLFIFFLRISRDRVWIHHIPRNYTISSQDTPHVMMEIIDNCSRDCREKFEHQLEGVHMDHPGLQNPSKGDQPLELPYSAISEIIPVVLEDAITAFHPRLVRKRSDSLRQYLYNALMFSIFPQENTAIIESFLSSYEAVRFGGKLISEAEFYELFSKLLAVIRGVSIPESQRQESISGSVALENASLIFDTLSANSETGSVIVREKSRNTSFLHPLSEQESTRMINSSSELSLTELVHQYKLRTASRRGSELGNSTNNTRPPSSVVSEPENVLSRYSTKESFVSFDSAGSNKTFVHYT